MRKILWLIVCLMTMTLCLSSCNEETLAEKFALENKGNTYIGKEQLVFNMLHGVERYFYLYSKNEPSDMHYLRTKMHVITDTLIFGEIYVRGKNGFDGGTMQTNLFIYLEKDGNKYISMIDDDKPKLAIRLNFCKSDEERNSILSKLAKKGILNDETEWESFEREAKNDKYYKNKSSRDFAIKYLDKELDIAE